MPSHLKPTDARPDSVSELDIIGNEFADRFAGIAAEEVQVSVQTASDCKYYYSLTKNIQLRIAKIIMSLPSRSKIRTVRTAKEIALTLNQKIDASSHQPVLKGSRYTCHTCGNSFLTNDPSFQHWLLTPCIPVPSCSRPTPLSSNNLHIGNQSIHFSHKMSNYKGFVYCKKCGSRRGALCIKNLARPCQPASNFGKSTLSALSHGRMPPGLTEWPAEITPEN